MTILPSAIPVDQVIAIIEEVARTIVMPRFGTLKAGEISTKSGPNDLVTIADVESERELTKRLTALMPGSLVVGEEGYAADPSVIEALAGDRPTWVLDPVDGTNNFANGRDRFAVIVALCQGGRTLAGWIHHPPSGRTGWAVAGQGVWVDGQPVRANPPRAVTDLTGRLRHREQKRLKIRVPEDQRPKRVTTYMCTGVEYLDLASGGLDFAYYTHLKPWDHAAGILMYQEAGGFVGVGRDATPYRPTGLLDGPLLVAPDRATWDQLSRLIATLA